MAKQAAGDIAAVLRRAVEAGTYERFQRLPASRQLAVELGVARNTLRAALCQLESEGLLETRAGSGTYVIWPGESAMPPVLADASPLELMDARFALEPHICRLAVLHGRREDFDQIETLCREMESSLTDPQRFSVADTAFHRVLAEATRNQLLIWLITQINHVRALDEWTRMRHLTLNRQIITDYNYEHRMILESLRAREPEGAASTMKAHLERARLSLTRASET
ncbi:MAG: FCD domain-containing protein [Pseudomonadota bacterium]